MIVDALIPALNEEESLPGVLAGLQGRGLRRVVVVDNGSRDATADVARAGGAEVVYCARRGYGSACLRGLDHLHADAPDVVVFLDADGADDPADLPAVLGPIAAGEADLVIGSRVRGQAEAGALTPVQRFGNALSCTLVRGLFGVRFTDLGPFRAITWDALQRLDMADPDFGWTVEMQAKAARRGLRCAEVPVDYRRRYAGQSKVSGTLEGSARAGAKILWTIGRERLRGRP
ncbi:MAG: glycosyltransferase [Myxococcales bacterium]|nr:glycosyltransferase [Myxococcales bacterium]